MSKKQLYRYVATVAGLIGVGMILGQSLSNGTTNTATWIGGLLILGAAVTFGMSIASGSDSGAKPTDVDEAE